MSPFLSLFKLLLPSLFSVPHFPSSFPSSFCLLFSSHSTFALSFEVHFPLLFKPNLPPHQSTWLAAFTEGNCWTSKKSNQELSFLKNHSHVLRRLRLFHLLLRETGKENPGNLFWIVIPKLLLEQYLKSRSDSFVFSASGMRSLAGWPYPQGHSKANFSPPEFVWILRLFSTLRWHIYRILVVFNIIKSQIVGSFYQSSLFKIFCWRNWPKYYFGWEI